MRVALVGDVHGNLLALDAVLDELRGEVDELLCLGDVAVGPQPVEALERVRELGCPVLMGNWDAWFLDGFPELPFELGRRLVETGAWWAAHLGPEHRAFMRSFAPSAELRVRDGLKLAAFHGTPLSLEEGIEATTPDDEVERLLDGIDAAVVACGHTHFQLLRRHGDAIVVNPGSVGLPFCRKGEVMQIAPWAEYAVVTVDDGRLSVDLRRTSFDAERFADLIRRSGMPYADWWADLWAPARSPVPVAAA